MERHVHKVPLGNSGGDRVCGEIDGVQIAPPPVKPQTHMPPVSNQLNAVYGQPCHHEHRLRAAAAAGLQEIQSLDLRNGQHLRSDGTVQVQGADMGIIGIEFGSYGADFAPELRDVVPADGKARRQFVAAVAFQQR